ncbi:hypothetical protein CFBP2533_12150 [Xanthomonas hortorum pv. pelargonii]|nr:hypothetical protein CFBP2533_12150 [Xanthomonas hortorum pv. pelargonii]CAD0314333.1 hypothetical protein CFBP2533_12150 [Xanthomonas hortorum pv. pelargonii]
MRRVDRPSVTVEIPMSSPATVTIDNRSSYTIVTQVTRNYWVEGDGDSIDGKTIEADSKQTYTVKAKTAHHGELDIDLIDSATSTVIATLNINSIKDPQDGSGLAGTSKTANLQIAAVGHRSSPGDEDLRRIDVTLVDVSIGRLRYNDVSMKASHNSYQRDETLREQITWNPKNHYDCGCGGLELDIAQSDDGLDWSVGHKGSYDKHYRQLSGFLSDLAVWSKENDGHDVITLHLDLKHTATKDFPDQLDAYLKDRLPRIYTPGELMGSQETLALGAERNGWPFIEDLKNTFLVCVTGNKQDKQTYAETVPKSRLCFADKDTDADENPSDPHRVFFNFHIFHSDRDQWMKTFKACVGRPEVIIRAYLANSEDNWNDCLDSGCCVIATNKISDHAWALVGAQRFAKRVPLL